MKIEERMDEVDKEIESEKEAVLEKAASYDASMKIGVFSF